MSGTPEIMCSLKSKDSKGIWIYIVHYEKMRKTPPDFESYEYLLFN